MRSSVLRGERAIKVNIDIVWAFVGLRCFVIEHAELKRENEELLRSGLAWY